jgi:hypothetical protein
VPSSEFEAKSLRRAWFVPLCSELLMRRSVPRTHTSTARGGRMGLRPRGYWTRVLEGVLSACRLRARATKGTPAVPQCVHTLNGTCTHTRKVASDSHARTRAARVRARWRKGHLRGARTHGLAKRTERVRTYHGTHGTAAPIRYYLFSQRGRRVLGGDSRGSGRRRAGHSQRGRTEYEHARGYCQRYRVPHGAGPLQGAAASVLTARCGEGTRTAVRRCVRAHAGVLADTNGALARGRTARHRAHGGRTGHPAG